MGQQVEQLAVDRLAALFLERAHVGVDRVLPVVELGQQIVQLFQQLGVLGPQ